MYIKWKLLFSFIVFSLLQMNLMYIIQCVFSLCFISMHQSLYMAFLFKFKIFMYTTEFQALCRLRQEDCLRLNV